MARRNESPEDKRRRELVQGFLKDNPIKDPNDIQELMKEMMRQVLQGGLEAELDDELGYTRYDYRNKETENSRNGFSKKTMHTISAIWKSTSQEIVRENLSHAWSRSIRTPLRRILRQRSFLCTPRE